MSRGKSGQVGQVRSGQAKSCKVRPSQVSSPLLGSIASMKIRTSCSQSRMDNVLIGRHVVGLAESDSVSKKVNNRRGELKDVFSLINHLSDDGRLPECGNMLWKG